MLDFYFLFKTQNFSRGKIYCGKFMNVILNNSYLWTTSKTRQ